MSGISTLTDSCPNAFVVLQKVEFSSQACRGRSFNLGGKAYKRKMPIGWTGEGARRVIRRAQAARRLSTATTPLHSLHEVIYHPVRC